MEEQNLNNSNVQPNNPPQGAPQNKETNVLMAALSYLGPLVIISYITSKDDPFVKFHIKQGLVVFVIEIAIWFLGMSMFYSLYWLMNLINFGTLILSILGIINAVHKKEKELPLVGGFAKYFKI